MTPVRRFWRSVLVVALIGGSGVGCQSPTPPSKATATYDRLVREALAQAKARPDTSLFWFTNTGTEVARSLMIDLQVDYLRYDRRADVFCVWTGGTLRPVQGYVTAPVSNEIPADSIAALCTVDGPCSTESVTENWSRFRCG